MSKGSKKKRSHPKAKGGSARRKAATKSRTEEKSHKWRRPESEKDVKKTKKTKKVKKSKKSKRTGLAKRGTLTAALFALFDKVGVKKVTYSAALQTAKAAKKDTCFNTAHFNKYKARYTERKQQS